MVPVASAGTLDHLRQALEKIEKNGGFPAAPAPPLTLGPSAVDAALGGGLARAALHELAPAVPIQLGAAAGFALALAARAVAGGGSALVIQTDFAVLEAGAPYGPGLDALGLPTGQLILLRVQRAVDALWAFEETLKSRGVAVAIAELPQAAAADLTATRRLSLAARASGGLGLLLRHHASAVATAAVTRWQVAAAPSAPDRYGGLGRIAFDLSLNRNRRGRCGRFLVCWNHHERVFLPALPVGVAAPARDGSTDPQPLARAG